jgi:Xaa-Pro aminopeptidase
MRSNPRLGIPESEYRRRYGLVMDRMREANLDAMLVKNPENICYLSGYETPGHYNFHAPVLSTDEPLMVMRRFEEANIEEFSWLTRHVTIEDHEHPADVVARNLEKLRLGDKRIGYEQGINKDGLYCSVEDHAVLGRALPKAKFVDATAVAAGARVIKSGLELDMMRESARIAETAVEAGIGVIQPELYGKRNRGRGIPHRHSRGSRLPQPTAFHIGR